MLSLTDLIEKQAEDLKCIASRISEFKPEEHVLPDLPVDRRILAVYKYLRQTEMDTNKQAGLPALKLSGLTFNEAMKAMHSGYKVRLPEWTGYWFINNGEMSLLTREGDILNTPDFNKFSSRNDWEIALKGLGFDFALLALKAGKLVTRATVYNRIMFMRPAHTMTVGYILTSDQSLPGNLKSWLKNKADFKTEIFGQNPDIPLPDQDLVPVNLEAYLCSIDDDRNITNGWTPSQADLMATDWEVIQVPEWINNSEHPGLSAGSQAATFTRENPQEA